MIWKHWNKIRNKAYHDKSLSYYTIEGMIPKDLKSPITTSSIIEISKVFSREIRNGNVTDAMKRLSGNM